MARIDILLPVKNGIDYLAESLDSVLAQTVSDWRLLILDHGSTDGSRDMAQAYAARDSRIELHAFPEAQGLSGLLNCGLDLCNAEFIMRHDADDICFPHRMEIVLQAFADNPEVAVIGGQAEVIDGSGQTIGILNLPVESRHLAAAGLFYNPMAHPTTMLRHSAIKSLGIRYGNDFLRILPESERMEVPALAEDYFLFGQLAILGKCKNVPQQLIRYRWHASNVSVTKFADQMNVSLAISRYLARSLCALHQLDLFDPAPFCGLGGRLLAISDPDQVALDEQFAHMAAQLRRGFGNSRELERELQFRHVVATRNTARMLWRYALFRLRYRPVSNEASVVRTWLVGRLPLRRIRNNTTTTISIGTIPGELKRR